MDDQKIHFVKGKKEYHFFDNEGPVSEELVNALADVLCDRVTKYCTIISTPNSTMVVANQGMNDDLLFVVTGSRIIFIGDSCVYLNVSRLISPDTSKEEEMYQFIEQCKRHTHGGLHKYKKGDRPWLINHINQHSSSVSVFSHVASDEYCFTNWTQVKSCL